MRKFLVSFFPIFLFAASFFANSQTGEKFANAQAPQAEPTLQLTLDSLSYISSAKSNFEVSFYAKIPENDQTSNKGNTGRDNANRDNTDKSYTLQNTRFVLCIDPSTTLSTRTALESWANGSDESNSSSFNNSCLFSSQYNISSQERITMSYKMSDFGFDSSTVWGPKRVMIFQEGKNFDQSIKTFTVFDGVNKPQTPLNLSIAAHFDDISYYKPSITDEAKAVSRSIAPAGNLNKLSRFANINKNITLIIDPAIYSALELASDNEDEKKVSAFKKLLKGDTYYLPYDDINITALTHNNTNLYNLGVYNLLGAAAYKNSNKTIAWFNQGQIDKAVIEALKSSNIKKCIIVPDNSTNDNIFTPTPENTIPAEGEPIFGYTADFTLSKTLSGEATSEKANSENTPTGRIARFMAETAFINMELPSISRTVLAAFDRTAIEKFSDSDLSNLSNAMQSANWLNFTKFSDIKEPGPAMQMPDAAAPNPAELNHFDMATIYSNLDKISDFSNGISLYNSSQNFIYNYAARLASQSLEKNIPKRSELFSQLDSVTNSLLDTVKISTSDSVNILASDIQFSVGIKNTLGKKVKLNLHIDHNNYITTDKDSYPVELEPNSQQSINIPLHARANGSTSIKLTLFSGNGKQIGNSVEPKVNIFVQFTTVGTIVFFALLPILFVIGLIRTIKKRSTVDTRQKGLNV
ncbi:MAG: DUF6049 family protein [Bifidobacteriaceae bacterium]|jgi:hypothetical protein|nr:DUF6049 family protein [Bifidobacteriaceae bacterium]